jgi:SAM-dependent methyltransferase
MNATYLPTAPSDDPALAAYELLAPFYDRFTEGYDYVRWLPRLEAIALEHGLSGKRLLDVGCGTGKSFAPMLAAGYEVVGCDISPAMVERARQLAGGEAEVLVADMRDLPPIDAFDLVTCIDDGLNYLLSDEELEAAFTGMARNLRPGGLLLFDLNTIRSYREVFTRDFVRESDGALFCWRGESDEDIEPGGLHSAVIEIFANDGGDCWRRHTSRHVQRHHPRETVLAAVAAAELELLVIRGQLTGAQIEEAADEGLHTKLVHLARKPV